MEINRKLFSSGKGNEVFLYEENKPLEEK
jgi:hypothetical protein